jgi:hypothetical protein
MPDSERVKRRRLNANAQERTPSPAPAGFYIDRRVNRVPFPVTPTLADMLTHTRAPTTQIMPKERIVSEDSRFLVVDVASPVCLSDAESQPRLGSDAEVLEMPVQDLQRAVPASARENSSGRSGPVCE